MDLAEIYAGLILAVGPTEEPITLAQAKNHLRVSTSFTVDDTYITDLIAFARWQVETVMRRALITQQWRLSLKNWPGRDCRGSQGRVGDPGTWDANNSIKLPLPPLQSVQLVNYVDTNGTNWTMPQGVQIPSSPPSGGNAAIAGGYNVFTDFEPGRIVLAFSQIWPTVILLPGAPIQISFTCGYLDAATLQSRFEGFTATIHAMYLIIAYLYENRVPPSEMRKGFAASGLNYVIEEILTPFRIFV